MPILAERQLDRVTCKDAVGEILEALPITATHVLVVGAAALGYLFDAFDTYLVGFAMPSIAKEWRLSPVATGSLASAGMWGMFVGALMWGPIIDRFGRKPGFAGTVLGFSLLSGLSALATSTAEFLVFRFLSGVFLGGMLPVVSVMVAEQVGATHRGRFVAVPPAFWPVGLFAAASVSFALVPGYGWRALFYVGTLPALLSVFVIRRIPESPRWLAARGDRKSAAVVLRQLGASEEQLRSLENSDPGVDPVASGILFRSPYLKRLLFSTSVLFFGFFGYYGFVLWFPSILAVEFKMSLVRAFGYTILVGVFAILGKLTALLTIDVWGRKQLFYVGYGFAGIASIVFGLLTKPLHLLIGACVLSFLLEEAAAGCVVLPTELFPSQIRGTANCWSSAAGKLAAAASSLVFGVFMARHMYYAIFVTMAGFFWAACAIVFAIDTEAKGKVLREIGAS